MRKNRDFVQQVYGLSNALFCYLGKKLTLIEQHIIYEVPGDKKSLNQDKELEQPHGGGARKLLRFLQHESDSVGTILPLPSSPQSGSVRISADGRARSHSNEPGGVLASIPVNTEIRFRLGVTNAGLYKFKDHSKVSTPNLPPLRTHPLLRHVFSLSDLWPPQEPGHCAAHGCRYFRRSMARLLPPCGYPTPGGRGWPDIHRRGD
jgi:hypothetical protein